MSTITFRRPYTGTFFVQVDGQDTGTVIVNCDAGASGRGGNCYGITTPDGKHIRAGSLAKAKKMATKMAGG